MLPLQILEIIAFLDLFAAGLIVPQIPYQARELGCNHLVIGFMGALYSGFQLLSGPVTGGLSDLKGRSVTLLLSLSLSGVAYMLLGLTSSIVLFLGLRSVLGITKHTQLLAKSIAPDLAKDKNQLSEVYGRLNTFKQAGMSLGPIIGGYIIDAYPKEGFTIIAFIVGAIFAVNAGLVRKLPKEEPEDKDKKKEKTPIAPKLLNTVSTNLKQSIEQFYKIDWTKYWQPFLLRLLISLCVGVYVNNYVIFLKVKHDINPITIGYMISFFSAISSLTFSFIDKINKIYEKDNDYTQRSLHVFAVLTFSLLGLIFAPTIPIYSAFIIPLGISAAVGRLVTLEVVVSKADSEVRGTVLEVANNVTAVSGVVAPLLAGLIAEVIGVLYVAYVSVLFAAAGTYYSYIVRQKSLVIETKKDK